MGLVDYISLKQRDQGFKTSNCVKIFPKLKSRPKFLSDHTFQTEIISDQTLETEINPDQTFQTQVTSDQTFQTQRVSDQTCRPKAF